LRRFNPTYKGKPLFSPSLDPPSGAFSFAAEYEMVRAAHWRGYKWEHFDQLDTDSQALTIAEYRIEHRYQAVDSWANRPKANHGTGRTPTPRRRR
jgi:hypothetical protein